MRDFGIHTYKVLVYEVPVYEVLIYEVPVYEAIFIQYTGFWCMRHILSGIRGSGGLPYILDKALSGIWGLVCTGRQVYVNPLY